MKEGKTEVRTAKFDGTEAGRIRACAEILLDSAVEHAREVIETGEESMPMAFAMKGQKAIAVPIPFATAQEKQSMFNAINKIFREEKPEIAAFISEAWVVTKAIPEGEIATPDIGCAPSEHPDKKECLVAVAEFDSGSIIRTYEIDRSQQSPRLVLLKYNDTIAHGRARIFHGVFQETPAGEIH